MRRCGGRAGVYLPAVVVKVEVDLRIEQVEVCVPEAVYSADVLPIAVELIGKEPLAVIVHRGDKVVAEVVA